MKKILEDKSCSIKRMSGLLKRITDINDLPNRMYFAGDNKINKAKRYNSMDLTSRNHFRKSLEELKVRRNNDIEKFVKENKYFDINRMSYKEMMKRILFGGKENGK